MALITNQQTMRQTYLFISPDDTNWVDYTDFVTSIEGGAGEREIGEVNTAGADTPVLGWGKKGSEEITVKCVYTETDDEPFDDIRDIHEDDGVIYLQYRPVTDGEWYKTGKAGLLSCTPPGGEMLAGDPVLFEFVVRCTEIGRAAAST